MPEDNYSQLEAVQVKDGGEDLSVPHNKVSVVKSYHPDVSQVLASVLSSGVDRMV